MSVETDAEAAAAVYAGEIMRLKRLLRDVRTALREAHAVMNGAPNTVGAHQMVADALSSLEKE